MISNWTAHKASFTPKRVSMKEMGKIIVKWFSEYILCYWATGTMLLD